MSKVYLVWNEGRTECVGFTDKEDAKQAAGISRCGNPVACLVEHFRESYADEDCFSQPRKLEKFEMQEVDLR